MGPLHQGQLADHAAVQERHHTGVEVDDQVARVGASMAWTPTWRAQRLRRSV